LFARHAALVELLGIPSARMPGTEKIGGIPAGGNHVAKLENGSTGFGGGNGE
jgi:hypothetical protein